MYDTSLGRFLSRDPIEDGNNLYEYVRSSPQNLVDPDGLQANEVPYEIVEPGRRFFTQPSRSAQIKSHSLREKEPSLIKGTANAYERKHEVHKANTEKHIIIRRKDLKPGDLIGTGGALPCILVLVFEKKKGPEKDNVYAFHFKYQADPVKTLSKYEFGRAAKVVIGGGDNTDNSNYTLKRVLTYFSDEKHKGALEPIVVNYKGAFLDKDGKIYRFSIDTPVVDDSK